MRATPEWIGKTDNSVPPPSVKRRIIESQDNRCALTAVEFRPGCKIEFDHKVDLWLHGENRESNLRAVTKAAHRKKTDAQATIRAKVMRQKEKHLGLRTNKRWSPHKKKMNGDVVDRETGECIS